MKESAGKGLAMQDSCFVAISRMILSLRPFPVGFDQPITREAATATYPGKYDIVVRTPQLSVSFQLLAILTSCSHAIIRTPLELLHLLILTPLTPLKNLACGL